MGVYIYLTIQPAGIEPAAWQDYYHQVRDFLLNHPDRLVGLRRAQTPHGQRLVYTCQLERDENTPTSRRLEICGDLASMTSAETFSLYEDLSHYQPVYQPDRHPATESDLLQRVIAGHHAPDVFGAKTQGHPYHLPLLGAAMLAEARFPGQALVSGDISPAQCQQAADTLAANAGLRVPLPLLVDAERLFQALVGPQPSLTTLESFYHAARLTPEDRIKALRDRVPRETLLDWLAKQLASNEDKVTLGVLDDCRTWLNATADLDGLYDAACQRPGGPGMTAETFTSALIMTGVTLPAEPIAGLDQLERPAAAPPSVPSQFGNAMLDIAGLGARNCRYRLGTAAVNEYLQPRFPQQADVCRRIIEEDTAKLIEQLQGLGTWATRTSAFATEAAEVGDGESFVQHQVEQPLTPAQKIILDTFADHFKTTWQEWRILTTERLGAEIPNRQRMLARGTWDRSIALTEDGWAWIDAEQDPLVLDLLLMLTPQPNNQLLFTNIRRGIMEHPDLCHDFLNRLNAQ